MTDPKPEILAALQNCDFATLNEIRSAIDSKIQEAKSAFIAQAEQMGLACHDGNGKTRKRRNSSKHTEA